MFSRRYGLDFVFQHLQGFYKVRLTEAIIEGRSKDLSQHQRFQTCHPKY